VDECKPLMNDIKVETFDESPQQHQQQPGDAEGLQAEPL